METPIVEVPPAKRARRAPVHALKPALALVLSIDEFAAAVSVTRRTIVRLIDAGKIRAVKVGPKLVRIPRSELDRILSSDARTS